MPGGPRYRMLSNQLLHQEKHLLCWLVRLSAWIMVGCVKRCCTRQHNCWTSCLRAPCGFLCRVKDGMPGGGWAGYMPTYTPAMTRRPRWAKQRTTCAGVLLQPFARLQLAVTALGFCRSDLAANPRTHVSALACI